jgi:hypothetical protein
LRRSSSKKRANSFQKERKEKQDEPEMFCNHLSVWRMHHFVEDLFDFGSTYISLIYK